MKLKQKNPSIQQQIFDAEKEHYEIKAASSAVFYEGVGWAIGPKPPSAEAIKKAQFVDKTYVWKNAGIRPGN
jgi:hypothetical protein